MRLTGGSVRIRAIAYTGIIAALIFVITACDDGEPQHAAPVANRAPPSARKAEVTKGEMLYATYCMSCHGARGEGAAHWDSPGADGKYPPPPLDGSGHAWHHPSAVLREIILNGSVAGKGNMPSWKDKLSEQDVEALIVWMQSLWPADIYNAWLEAGGHSRP